MKIKDQKQYDIWRDSNQDDYGKACLDYGEKWAELMEQHISQGKRVCEVAKETSYIVNKMSGFQITGFMYQCAILFLDKTWEHSDELLQWYWGGRK